MYKYKFIVGDDSGDGHDKRDHYLISSSHPREEVWRAYLKTAKDRGYALHDDGSLNVSVICTEYAEIGLTDYQIDMLNRDGFPVKELFDPTFLGSRDILTIFCWMVSQSLPEYNYQVDDDDYPMLQNQYPIGYGVFI